MTAYTVIVNGKTYQVEIEKNDKKSAIGVAIGSQAVAVSTPASAVQASQATSVSATPGSAGNAITAPMPGKIIDIKVSVGDNVKRGQEIIILEAMKMHNPVLATNDGVIKDIYVKAGDSVQTGATLISIG